MNIQQLNIKSPLTTLVALTGLFISSLSFAGVEVETDENGITLAGHDAVSYFTENAAVEGSTEFTAVHNDAIYLFSSADNRDAFNANPEKYQPEFGGFCAYGASLGKKFDIDGKAFEVVNGKLYVNKSPNVYEIWAQDKAENINKANQQWPNIVNTPAGDL